MTATRRLAAILAFAASIPRNRLISSSCSAGIRWAYHVTSFRSDQSPLTINFQRILVQGIVPVPAVWGIISGSKPARSITAARRSRSISGPSVALFCSRHERSEMRARWIRSAILISA
jgi:hypothetical protein